MILVTGGTGFVGSHLLLHLLQNSNLGGEKILAIYRTSSSILKTKKIFSLYGKESLFENINWIEADIIDVPSLENVFHNVTKVYHCAAAISFDPADENLVRKVNIEGTANIVNFSLQHNVQKLCYVSSIAALGDLKEHENTITEETEWNQEKPHSDYAISKYGAEMEIWRGQQEGLNVIIVNPGVILGPGFWNTGSGEIFTRVANGLSFYTKGSTGFISIDDVVKLMHLLMESEISGERFTIVSENVPFENMVKFISDQLKVKTPSIYAKPWITTLNWQVDWFLHTFFNKKRTMSRAMAKSLHTKNHFSTAKITAALDYAFEKIESAVKRIAVYFPKK